MAMQLGKALGRPAVLAGATAGLAVVVVGVFLVVAEESGPPGTSSNPAPSETPKGCTQKQLKLPDSEAFATTDIAVSPSGDYIAAGTETANFLWHNGEPKVLTGDSPSNTIAGVSSSGMVVGTNDVSTVHTGGGYEPLEDAGSGVVVTDVNGDGVIVGYERGNVGPEQIDAEITPLRWEDGAVRRLDVEPGNRAGALTVTEDGTVLGFQADADAQNEVSATPWMWTPDGGNRAIPWPEGNTTAVPRAVAGDWVLAQVEGSAVYRWRLSRPDKAEKLAARMNIAGIDDAGRVYGAIEGEIGFHDGDAFRELRGGYDVPLAGVSTDGTVLVGNGGYVWNCER